MTTIDDIHWIKKQIQRAGKRLSKVKRGTEKVEKIEKKLDKVDKHLDELKESVSVGDNKTFTALPTDMKSMWSNDNGRMRPGADTMTVTLPKKGYRSRMGVNNKYNKLPGFPAKRAELQFDVFVDENWQSVKGGKLPGLFIGRGTGGKSYEKNDGSYRIMWRRKGQLVGYLYPCTDQGPDLSKMQGKEFLEACDNEFPAAGIDLWRRSSGTKMEMKAGEWNSISMGMELNDAGVANGKIWLEVNGTRSVVRDAYITANPSKNTINGVQWSMWYGGSNASWAPNSDQKFQFKNIGYRVW